MCGQDCEGFDCWSPEAIHARAQNAAVDSARDAADEALHAKLERVVGALAVERVMLGVAIFHAIMAVCLCGVESSKDPRARLQNGAWGLKLLLYVGLIAGMFWVDTDMFDDVTALFRVGAFCFVLVQLTMLIESAYVTDGYLGEKRETHGPGWLYLSLLCVLAMYGFTVFVFAVTIAKNQSAPDGCSEGVWAVMINFFLMIATTGLSIVRMHTSNLEKASKKNERAFSRRFSSSSSCGLFGLSLPLPPTVEHHFPVGGGGGARQLHTIVAGGAACGERQLTGRCARACVHDTGLGVDIDGVAVVVVGGGAAGLAIVAVAAAFDAVADLDRLNRGWRATCCYVAAAAGQRVIHKPRGLHALRFGSGTPMSGGRWAVGQGRRGAGHAGRGGGTSRAAGQGLFGSWSKSKKVNCIQGIVTSARLSRLLNVNVSPTLFSPFWLPGPCKPISPNVGTSFDFLRKLTPACM